MYTRSYKTSLNHQKGLITQVPQFRTNITKVLYQHNQLCNYA